jgi:hypothetical protein
VDAHAAHRSRDGRHVVSIVLGGCDGQASIVSLKGDQKAVAEKGRHRHYAREHWTTMGRAERMGAIAVDRRVWA